MSNQPILTLNIGNSRVQIARFEGVAPVEGSTIRAMPNDPFDALADAIRAEIVSMKAGGEGPVVVACSVNPRLADRLEQAIRADAEFLLIRRDVPLPIHHTLDDEGEKTVGIDRLCDAIGAYAMLNQACVIVDTGSAITVDFVDGKGTFHGGAIAPGARMMLRALHEKTAALPLIEFAPPEGVGDDNSELQPFGRNTPQAMLNGVFFALRGLVRQLAERYAEKYEAYPTIVATGGDAPTLFGSDALVERIVPDLTLRGVAHAFDAWMKAPDDDTSDSGAAGGPTEARDLAR